MVMIDSDVGSRSAGTVIRGVVWHDELEWRGGPAAADDWACTSHTGTTQIPECVRLGIEDGATAAASPLTLHPLRVDTDTQAQRSTDVEEVAGMAVW